jgi:hypothetical protein
VSKGRNLGMFGRWGRLGSSVSVTVAETSGGRWAMVSLKSCTPYYPTNAFSGFASDPCAWSAPSGVAGCIGRQINKETFTWESPEGFRQHCSTPCGGAGGVRRRPSVSFVSLP